MKKKYIVIAVAILALGFFGYKKVVGKQASVQQNVQQVQTYEVKKGNIEMDITGNGNIQSSVLKELKAKDAASIDSIYGKLGQKVSKDEMLIKLKNEDESGATSRIEDKKFEIEKQQREVNKLKDNQKLLVIKSKFDGTITKEFFEVGDDVPKGGSFATVTNKDVLELTVPFNKAIASKVKVGDTAKVYIPNFLSNIDAKIVNIEEKSSSKNEDLLFSNITFEVKNTGAISENIEAKGVVIIDGAQMRSLKTSKFKWKEDGDVKAQYSGKVVSIKIKKGDSVKKGDIIATLKNDDLTDQIQMAQRELTNNKKKLSDLTKDDKNVISSPIAGTIVAMNVVSGETIIAGQTLGKVADLDSFEIKISVDELDVLSIKEGLKAQVRVPAIKDFVFEGIVKTVSHEGKVVNGTAVYEVVIGIQNNEKNDDLRLGMSANAKIIIDSKENVVVVPKQYVKKDEQGYYVSRKEDDGVKRVHVEVGLVDSDYSQIKSNIKEGDILVNE